MWQNSKAEKMKLKIAPCIYCSAKSFITKVDATESLFILIGD